MRKEKIRVLQSAIRSLIDIIEIMDAPEYPLFETMYLRDLYYNLNSTWLRLYEERGEE